MLRGLLYAFYVKGKLSFSHLSAHEFTLLAMLRVKFYLSQRINGIINSSDSFGIGNRNEYAYRRTSSRLYPCSRTFPVFVTSARRKGIGDAFGRRYFWGRDFGEKFSSRHQPRLSRVFPFACRARRRQKKKGASLSKDASAIGIAKDERQNAENWRLRENAPGVGVTRKKRE